MPLPALFIGRFQPFHLGHLDAIKQILADHKKIIIGIGSSQYHDFPENPFPSALRRRMIEESLAEAGISRKVFSLVEIPDIHDDSLWVAHVENLAEDFGAVYSGTPKVQTLFKKAGTHPVAVQKFNIAVSGTSVRRKMARGKKWETLVPPSVAKIIKRNL